MQNGKQRKNSGERECEQKLAFAAGQRKYAICKDMDGLDRVRFNGLDIFMLRTPYAKKLPLIAGCLLQENIVNAVFYPPKE